MEQTMVMEDIRGEMAIIAVSLWGAFLLVSMWPTKWCPPPWMLGVMMVLTIPLWVGCSLNIRTGPEWAMYLMVVWFAYIIGWMTTRRVTDVRLDRPQTVSPPVLQREPDRE